MDKMIKVFITIFVTLIVVIMMNTLVISYIFPVFSDISTSTGMGNQNFNYSTMSGYFQIVFLFALNIFVIVPFAHIIGRLVKREQRPEERYYYGV